MYCVNCGKKLKDGADICLECGKLVSKSKNLESKTADGGVAWSILGFFVPIVGLVLYIIWKDSKPLSAKNAGLGALISVILYFVLLIIWILLVAFLMLGMN